MDKLTYLAELAEGLARWVPERERQDILRYYAEYFEEAGPEREAEVVAELGDPWALSCRLAVEGGYVTQESANSWTPPKTRKARPAALAGAGILMIVVIVAVAALASRVGRFVGRYVASDRPAEAVAYEEGELSVVEGTGFDWASGAEFAEEFDEVEIDIGLGDVSVYAGDQAAVYLVDDEEFNCHFEWKVEDGKLKVYDLEENKFEFKVRPELSASVTVVVPYGTELDQLKIDTGVGDVMVENSLPVEKLAVNTGVGNVWCYYPVADRIELNSGLGEVDLYTDTEVGERIELNSGTGNVNLYGYPAPKMELHSGTGTVTAALDGCVPGECTCDLSTGFGNVSLDGRDCGNSVKTGSSGDYALEAASGFGNVDVWFNG